MADCQPPSPSLAREPVASPTADRILGSGLGLAALSALLFTVGASDRMRVAFSLAAYPTVLSVLLVWAWWSIRGIHGYLFDPDRAAQGRKVVFGAAIVISLVTYLTVPHRFRILYDEFDLLSTANSMSLDGTPSTVRSALWHYGAIRPVQVESPPWRPLLYPTAVHAAHTLLGLHPANAFRVNFLVLLGLLFVAGATVLDVLGVSAAVGAMLLVAACPIVALCATSGGFDLFAMLLVASSLSAAYRHARAPTDRSLNVVWAQLVALCHTRYESPLFVLVVLGGLLASRAIRWIDLRTRPILVGMTPILLLPILWQRLLQSGRSFAPTGVPDFSLRHLLTNLTGLGSVLVDPWRNSPYPRVALMIGLAALLLAMAALATRRTAAFTVPARNMLAATGLIVLTSTSIFLAHFLGDLAAPTSARFYLLPCAAVVLCPALAAWVVPAIVPPRVLLPYAIGVFALYHPVAVRDRVTDQLVVTREIEWVWGVLSTSNPPGRTLVVAEEPTAFTALGFSSVGFDVANQQRTKLETELRHGMFDRMVILQELDDSTEQPTARTRLEGPWQTGTVAELRLTDAVRGRVLEVTRRPATAPPGG